MQAFTPDAICEALADPVAKWSQRWFVREAATVAAARHDSGPQPIVPPQVQRVDGAVATATLAGRGKRQMLETALDVVLAEQMPGEGDHRLLDAFATEIVEDLVAGIDGFLGGPVAPTQAGGRIVASIAIGHVELLSIAFPDHALVARLKGRCRPLRRTTGTPVGRLAALRDTVLVAEAVLGRVRLPVGEVEQFAVGDVLLLDQLLADKIALRLAAQGDPIAKGRLERSRDGKVALQF